MKTRIATILFLLGIFFASTAFATVPVPATVQAKKEIKELVVKMLHYPQFAIDNKTECSVYLSLKVNENGSLEVDCANCMCGELKDFVVKRVENIQSEELQKFCGVTMLLQVKFDLI